MIPRHDRTLSLPPEARKKNAWPHRPIFFLLSLLCLSFASLLTSCGGGPTVASPTGRTLYLATTSGIYGFKIMSDGTLSPVSSSPLVPSSYTQIAATMGTNPMLIGANGGSSLTTWSLSGGGLGSGTTLSLSSCTNFSAATGVAVTSDNNYVLVVNGGATSTNIASLPLSGGTCRITSTTTTDYPVQPALDCSVAGASYCLLFLTLSSQATTTATVPVAPEEDSFAESTGTVASLTPSVTPFSSCTNSICPQGVAFNANTLYFYATFNGGSPSLQSIAPQTSTAAQSTSFSTPNLNLPCIDALGGVAYIPTSNGYVYSVSTANGGGVGSPSTVLSPQTFGTTLTINSCAVGGS
ncbi:MAG: hypothetical protein ACP5OP_01885 [Leptospirillia bacterium]